MTKKQVWRYWCDFCKKGSLSGGHMASHEKHCTANPNRICRLCLRTGLTQRPIAELMACLNTKKENGGLADLRELTENCPICILAAIRQSGICKWDGDPENPAYTITFDFKMELASWWSEENNAKAEADEARYERSYA